MQRLEHGPVLALAWEPNGRHLASGGQDGLLRVFDTETEAGSKERKEGGRVDHHHPIIFSLHSSFLVG